jgi:hypothetical protein
MMVGGHVNAQVDESTTFMARSHWAALCFPDKSGQWRRQIELFGVLRGT